MANRKERRRVDAEARKEARRKARARTSSYRQSGRFLDPVEELEDGERRELPADNMQAGFSGVLEVLDGEHND